MNLLTKVLLTLILVIAVGMLTVSLLVERSATSAYQGYLGQAINEQLLRLADQAVDVYAQNGSWESVQGWLDQYDSRFWGAGGWRGGMGAPRGRGPMAQSAANRVLLLVDPASGAPLVLADLPAVSPQVLARGAPVRIDDQERARIVDTRDNQAAIQAAIGPAEQTFLDRISQALLLSSVAAGLAALIVGSLLAYSILKPLRALEAGVMQVAQGHFETQVAVGGQDEIGQLAQGFNHMAASLQRQEALRQRMVADIAHELRTPLSVIQGNLQALLDGVYPLDKQEIATIHDETRVLSRLIQDLHELAQAEAGSLPLAIQPLPAQEVMEHMAALFRPLAEAKGVGLVVQPPPAGEPPLLALGDADRVHQIMHNLLGNGLRHAPTGGLLTLQILISPYHDYTKYIRFMISNNGAPIPPDELPRIFDRFYRGDPSRTRHDLAASDRTTSGAGLGLAIVKALVEAQGGRVGAHSSPDAGTTLWFDLPRAGV